MTPEWILKGKISAGDSITSAHFRSGISVLVERPHVVNSKVLAAEILETWNFFSPDSKLIESLVRGEFKNYNIYQNSCVCALQGTESLRIGSLNEGLDACQKTLILRNMIPKRIQLHQEVTEAVLLDNSDNTASFYPNKREVMKSPILPGFPYRFRLIEQAILLEVLKISPEDNNNIVSESTSWLETKVLPKVASWCQNIPKHPIVPSIQLVPPKDYNLNLCHLKAKYAKKYVEIWPDFNNTDPTKYVYEDLSIAAYLITLWAEERKSLNLTEKQSFVDLGCGNGFLDHVLISEGHKGIGVDLRKRKIWDVYGEETNLIEMAIEPEGQLYPEYDWIIGNHADELTPWIPIIAARSSYNMRVFLLPCCFYTFDGKYARSHQQFTQYQSYLNFIKVLCQTMGFKVQRDKLRIPSTKRTCFVCPSRTYKKEDEQNIESKRNDFIKQHSKNPSKQLDAEAQSMNSSGGSPHETESSSFRKIVDFKPRDSVEVVQNCTKLDKAVIYEVVKIIVNAILSTDNLVSIQRGTDAISWNKGGTLKVADLCNILDKEMLQNLKNQRGGFQTLLRNNSDIFKIQNGLIHLQIPSLRVLSGARVSKHKAREHQRKVDTYKQRECFFHFNHPQGCPLLGNNCTFAHTKCA